MTKEIKVAVIGDRRVGKTSLIERFISNSFRDDFPSVFDHYEKEFFDDNEAYTLRIDDVCDTSRPRE